METKTVAIATFTVILAVTMEIAQCQEGDYSEPIRCFYCFGPAQNSSCADPVDPREDKGKALEVIKCESGICLKWTHYYANQLYMHRTCSHRLKRFRIMMNDGVCRSEGSGNGDLCMCGKNLCNDALSVTSSLITVLLMTSLAVLVSSLSHMPSPGTNEKGIR
ncbi:protein quiver-like isoform X2 [Mya arenaria]|uniref:protein quiver-like isoform X2 n=1 Tax=Mya arenaria TaxID=6604 RepID=UPI0022E1C2AC|nr:protein quiver-like isoform X2 [Mya arenaria]